MAVVFSFFLLSEGSCTEQRQEVQRSASKEGGKEEASGHRLY